MDNSLIGKNIKIQKSVEKIQKHINLIILNKNKNRCYLLFEGNYYSTKSFPEKLKAFEKRKTQDKMKKTVHLGFSILLQ